MGERSHGRGLARRCESAGMLRGYPLCRFLPMNLYQLFHDRFAPAARQPFLIRPGLNDLTFGEIDVLSARYSKVLREHNVGPDDRVMVQVAKSPEAVALYLACLRVGAIYIPLNVAYTVNEVAYFLNDTRPRLFVSSSDRQSDIESLVSLGVSVLSLDADGRGSLAELATGAEPDALLASRSGDDIAAILYTSGTTGRSKGAMLTLDNLFSNALALHDIWQFKPGDVLLHALPIFHVHGLFVALHCALLNASSCIFLPHFKVEELLAHLPEATVLMGVPTFYSRLLAAPGFDADQVAHMRLMISGSAPLTEQTFAEFAERTGYPILERYGMTETGMITSNPYDGERVAGTVGYALPDVEVRVCDEQGEILGPGEVGSVEVRGPNVFKGYWEMPEKTQAEFREDGFFITGDLGVLSEDGRLSLVGRGKDLIISGGYNIYPKEIELLLDESDDVKESAVVGVPHADLGEGVVAVVVPSASSARNEAALLEGLQARLARFKVPRKIVFEAELPRNAMGKVQKNVLRDTHKDLLSK